MTKKNTESPDIARISLVGIANAFKTVSDGPRVAYDIFQLSKTKKHYIFPASLSEFTWVFEVHTSILYAKDKIILFEIISPDGTTVVSNNISQQVEGYQDGQAISSKQLDEIRKKELATDRWVLITSKINGNILEPGRYEIAATIDGEKRSLGLVQFDYERVPTYTQEEIDAFSSDPDAAKDVRAIFSCKKCKSKMTIYSGLGRDENIEKSEGAVWYRDLQEDEFRCECGKAIVNLKYIKENLHALVGRRYEDENINFVRLYGHEKILNIIKSYNDVLSTKIDEKSMQEFIQNNKVLLAIFHAKKIYIKPDIIGKFQTDFAILDAMGCLTFIEIERPSLKLFKRKGHMMADLTHAYDQVEDWLNEYRKHKQPILERLGLQAGDVTSVRGAVIAGRLTKTDPSHLQRHLDSPKYPHIDFYTYDDLSNGLRQISRDLA